jgi:opacity protein-like surface antigen
MSRNNILFIVIVVAGLFAAAAQTTRTQVQQGQTGRYQLLSAQYRWPEIDAEHKLTYDEGGHLFRVDTNTGETSILVFILQEDRNGQLQGFWYPIGRAAAPNK